MSEKGSERRRHRRIRKRYTVRFGVGDFAHTGYTQDISESGLYLMANATFVPGTILQVQIEYPEKTITVRGVVRWAKELPPAFRRNLRGGMGIEFQAAKASKATASTAHSSPSPGQSPQHSSAHPPDLDERILEGRATSRRQVSTRSGSTFEVWMTEVRGGFYVRIFQLPRSDSSSEARFRQAFWTSQEADAAVKAFLKSN